MRAIDGAANVDPSPVSRSYIVDTGPPQTSITSGPGEGVPTNDRTPAFGFTASESAGFECQIDGGAFAPCASGEELEPLGDGPHSFAVRATDLVGNPDGSPATRGFAIDTRPPETSIELRPKDRLRTSKRNVVAQFALDADEPGSVLECSLDGAAFAPCTAGAAFKVKAKRGRGAQHSLAVVAVDLAGNRDPSPALDSFRAVRVARGA